jgi:uncharacterized protein (TIGR02246 family)
MGLSRSHLSWLIGLALLASCARADSPPSRDASRREVAALLDSVAASISRRDAAGIAALMPTDSSLVYISDGHPIRGTELRPVLGAYYAGLRQLSFRWDSLQLVPSDPRAWSAIGWATIAVVDTLGNASTSRAVFTWTVVRPRERWILALAHKTTLQ